MARRNPAATGKAAAILKFRKRNEGRAILQPNVRYLEMFQLLCRTGSLTETARLLQISQPAVSQALRELEAQFGLELFLRGSGQARPTAEALALRPDIERLLAQLGALTSRASELQDARAGHIAISAVPSVATHLLPAAIAHFRRDRPRSRIQLDSLPTSGVIEALKQESVDLGLVASPFGEPALIAEPAFETEFCCVVRADDRLALRPAIALNDLVGKSVIALPSRLPPGLLLRSELERNGARLTVDIEANSASSAVCLVRAGAGIAIIDPLPLLNYGAGLVARPFAPTIKLTVLTLLSRNRAVPAITQHFLKSLRAELRDSAAKVTALGIPARAL